MRQAVKSKVKRCTSAKVRRKKIHPRQMLEKSRNAVFFQWFVCRVSRKVGLLKRRVRRSGAERRQFKNCTPLWRKAHFEAKVYKTRQFRSTFWSSDVEKLYADVVKSTLGSENVQNTWVSRALFEVQMSKNCTPLWRKAHLEVKMLQNTVSSSEHSLEVQMSKNCYADVVKSTLGSENVQSTSVFGALLWSSDVEKLHAAVAKSTFWSRNVYKTRQLLGALLEVQMSKNCTPMWWKAHWEVKMLQNTSVARSTFWSSDVEKLHAAVAKQHIMEVKMLKNWGDLGALFEVQMLKKCTPMWWKAHWEVKMLKNCRSSEHFFEVQMSKNCYADVAKSTFWSLKCTKHVSFGALFWSSDVEKLVR